VRTTDLVGRLADGEFGIFLPGASAENARHAGERIRQEVAKVYFAPGATGGNGKTSLIDVNVAGVFFEQQLGFEDMFRSAARQLEAASPGSRIELKRIGPSRPSDRSRTRPSDGAAFPPQGLSVSTPPWSSPGLTRGPCRNVAAALWRGGFLNGRSAAGRLRHGSPLRSGRDDEGGVVSRRTPDAGRTACGFLRDDDAFRCFGFRSGRRLSGRRLLWPVRQKEETEAWTCASPLLPIL